MAKYQVNIIFPNGEEDLDDEIFDSYKEAEEYAWYLCGCYKEGGEILHMSNPGDYPLKEDDDCDYEIVKVD